MKKLCRWGFMSTAGIGKKNWQAIQLTGNATLVAVSSRSKEASRQFIDSCQSRVPFDTAPDAIEGYGALLDRDDIDAVYIPLPTGIRKEWVIRTAEKGKHVLCEKPCALNAEDLREMIEACRQNNVQFMDGVMLMHTLRLQKMKAALEKDIGQLRRVSSQLTFFGDPEFHNQNIRTDSNLEPHGCLGDVGWYNIRLSLWATQWQLPHAVRATTLTESKRENTPDAVPISLSGELYFDEGVSAGFYCGFDSHHQQWAFISGDQGFIQLRDFVLPFSNQPLAFQINTPEFIVDECQFDMLDQTKMVTTAESGNNAHDSQETKLFRHFSSLVLAGTIEKCWTDYALKTQVVLDACFESAKSDGKLIKIPKLEL
ncbi:MAG: Gfo/Idh/MocA family oxidoreductase [Planctomycetota bacterium]